ncbi:MAG: hypothetical protein ACI8Z9_002300 [Paraglaciecola sp.]
MDSSKYDEIEKKLAKNALSGQSLPDLHSLAEKVEKQQRSKAFVRLGVVGIFSMLLTLLAPLLMKHKKTSIQKKGKTL